MVRAAALFFLCFSLAFLAGAIPQAMSAGCDERVILQPTPRPVPAPAIKPAAPTNVPPPSVVTPKASPPDEDAMTRHVHGLLVPFRADLAKEQAELRAQLKAISEQLRVVAERQAQPGPPGPPGKDGRDGKDGTTPTLPPPVVGKDGKDGVPGRDGLPGPAGKDAVPADLSRLEAAIEKLTARIDAIGNHPPATNPANEELILYYTSRDCVPCKEVDTKIATLKAAGWPVVITRLSPQDAAVQGVPQLYQPFRNKKVVGAADCQSFLSLLSR